MIELPKRPKVVLTGGNGQSGLNAAKDFMWSPGNNVKSLVILVRTKEKAEYVQGELRDYRQRHSAFEDIIDPVITFDQDDEALKDADIWLTWKGMNLSTLESSLQKKNNDPELTLAKEAEKRNVHVRDLLLEENLKIAMEDAGLAQKHSHNAVYVLETNPVDALVRIVSKHAFKGPVISTGTMIETDRFTNILNNRLRKLHEEEKRYPPPVDFARASGSYIGEHGSTAVEWNINVGGVPIARYIDNNYSKKGIGILKEARDHVLNEANWIRSKTGKSPTAGPSRKSSELVNMILSEGGTIIGASVLLNGEYGLNDIALSVPVEVGAYHIKVQESEMDYHTRELFSKSAEHIRLMNKKADKLYQNIYQKVHG